MQATLRLYVNDRIRHKETRPLVMPRFLHEVVATQARFVASCGAPAAPARIRTHRTPTTHTRYVTITTGPVTAAVTLHA